MAFKLQLDESFLMAHVPWIDMPSSKIFYLKLRPPTRNSDLDSNTDVKSPQKFKIKVFSWRLQKFPQHMHTFCL